MMIYLHQPVSNAVRQHTVQMMRSILLPLALLLLLRPACEAQDRPPPEGGSFSLAVESSQESVAVYTGETFRGYAPARIAVSCDEPTILRCEKPGRVTRTDTLRGCADTAISVRLPLPATLVISSEPESARVHINGAFAGTTPIEIAGLPPDSVAISVTKPLCEPWYTSLAPAEGDRVPITARLQKRYATLSFLANRPGAALYVDDTLRSIGSLLNHRVRFGAHALRARDDESGREAFSMVTVLDGQALSFSAELGVRSTQRAVIAAFLPGSAQLADGDAVEGVVMMVGTLALGVNAALAQAEYSDRQSQYDAALESYANAATESEANIRHTLMEARKDDLDSYYAYRSFSFAGLVAGYLYTVVDAYLLHLTIDRIEIFPMRDPRGGPGVSSLSFEPGIRVKVGL